MRVIYFFLFLSFNFAFSQSIKGRVVDVNNEPLSGATVYIDGSTLGTTTNKLGYFELDYSNPTASDLIISYVGFTTYYLKSPQVNTNYKFVLQEEITSLNEIVLTKNPFSRKQMLSVFIANFLGTTKAGKKCTILNLDEVYFNYDRSNNTLYAYSDKPIEVLNPFLGYKIFYSLIRFEIKFTRFTLDFYEIKQMMYGGTSRFEETDNSPKIIKRRNKVFEGSVTQFFRNIATNTWGKDHFRLFEGNFMVDPSIHFKVKDSLSFKYITVKNQSKIENTFFSKFSLLDSNKNQSGVQFRTPSFFIDRYGVFTHYEYIFFTGLMSQKKVGDMLPNNFGM